MDNDTKGDPMDLLNFMNRIIILPAALVFLVCALMTPTQTAPPASETPSQGAQVAEAEAEATRSAEAVVERETATLTRGLECYDDPTGRTPETAVVKEDGSTSVRSLPADEAWERAHAGEVWVQKWCDAP